MRHLVRPFALLLVLTGSAVAQSPAQTTPSELPVQPQLQAPAEAPTAPQLAPAPDAPTPGVTAPATGNGATPLPMPHDLSPIGMYRQAHWMVKAVMLCLLFACFVTWTVWLHKTAEIFVARRRLRRVTRLLGTAASLASMQDVLGRIADPAAFMAQEVQ
ncbi:MAG: hypothetical protein LBE86_01005, partial [Gemmobacter sp.]|nr:hypothetical protein [Gemmobacter sp.]